MSKPHRDEIPVSVIKHTTVNVDFSTLNGEGKILYLNPKCVLIGLDGVPFILVVTPEFNKNDLINFIGEDLYEVKQLALQASTSYVPPEKRTYCMVPDWLLAFEKTEFLRFEYVQLDELWLWRNLPVQHLVLQNVRFNDPIIFADSIMQFKLLKEITHDDSLDEALIAKITASIPHIKLNYETA